MFVDKEESTRRSELCWSLLSTLLVCLDEWIASSLPSQISCVNEVQCGTGNEWSGLIGQHTPAVRRPRRGTELEWCRVLESVGEGCCIVFLGVASNGSQRSSCR